MAGTRRFEVDIEREASPRKMVVILRESGVSSTPRPIDMTFTVSGILDRPPQCASAHKADDDSALCVAIFLGRARLMRLHHPHGPREAVGRPHGLRRG